MILVDWYGVYFVKKMLNEGFFYCIYVYCIFIGDGDEDGGKFVVL